MSPQAAQSLDRRLEAYARSSGNELFVYIGKSTGGVPIEDWAVKAFKTWKAGRRGKDNGVVLFIMIDDRRTRIEVGYGLEGQLTDALTARIINDEIDPKIVAGDHDGAVVSGADAIVKVLNGKGLPGASAGPARASPPPLSLWQKLVYGLIGLALLALLATHPSLALYLLVNILSGGRRGYGGGSFGGGGFSEGGGFSGGGGGRSGGGGASGSW
jgi:uncharacterized protein